MADTSQTADSQEKLYFLEENEAYDFYIGKKAGGKILSSIRNAKKSIRIISPFINGETVDILRNKYVDDEFHDISMITCLTNSDLNRSEGKVKALDKLISYKKVDGVDTYKPALNTIFFYGDYIHEKLFLIDDAAFVGSVNFTNKGMGANHETCLFLKNPNVTKRLYEYFDTLATWNYTKWDVAELGKKVFFAKRNIEKRKLEKKGEQ
jgi:phosphatidylserine/phosphatidylglycerophosphate/cardiolipin synthase-like enzyme